MTLTVAIVVLALLGGVLANRFLRVRVLGEDAEATTVQGLISPLETLAVLLLAFVLVVAAESYSTAEAAAETEARVVDNLFEVAEYAPAAVTQRIQASAVCYARAISAVEWPELANGRASKAPSVWSGEFRAAFKEMGSSDPSFELLVTADKERSEARSERLSEATPAIPSLMYWFMVVAIALTITAFAFSLPRHRNGAEIITLAVLATLFTLSLLLIRDVDRPYDGVIAVDPAAMSFTEDDVTEDYVAAFGNGRLPCDEQGRKLPAA